MTDLTKQWKKGELLEGFYYVKCDWSDEIEIRYVHNGVDDWKAIVTEVPSYDEWKASEKQNVQLKELLKECGGLFNRATVDGAEPNNAELIGILTKIDEVLK